MSNLVANSNCWFSHAQEMAGAHIPTRTPCFTSLEEKIGVWWNEILKQEMTKAYVEERLRAIERGIHFHEGNST